MNKIDFSAFAPVRAKFNTSEYFLTAEQGNAWQQAKPLQGLKILHNFPLYANTLLKIEALLQGGAALWISAPRNIPPAAEAVSFIKSLGLPYIAYPQPLTESFDMVLDCSADYADIVKPELGFVEVTGTGSHFFQQNPPPYPVISVDDSQLKCFETTLGTGDGCLRALQQWFPEDFSGRQFTIFGFGKVGKGISRALQRHARQVAVIDVDPLKVMAATAAGFRSYLITDNELENVIRQSFAIITATGRENIISTFFPDKSWFANSHLVNMGVRDEYGPAFADQEIVFDKQAINFSLTEPTLTRYIDPIFYAHNLGAQLLVSGQYQPGYHAFPSALDAAISERWQAYHSEYI
jgi:adenosylhomocysteinase